MDQISNHSNNDLPFYPNLILINAGTNDVAQDYFLSTVDDRLESMINKLLDHIPGTVAIVSTLLVNLNATKQELTENVVNPKYVKLVEKMAGEGKLVHLADMSSVAMDMINKRDGTHPTDCMCFRQLSVIFADENGQMGIRLWPMCGIRRFKRSMRSAGSRLQLE